MKKQQKGIWAPQSWQSSSATGFVLEDEEKREGFIYLSTEVSHAIMDASDRKNNENMQFSNVCVWGCLCVHELHIYVHEWRGREGEEEREEGRASRKELL